MAWTRNVVVSLAFLSLLSVVHSRPFLKTQTDFYCESWMFTVETNNAGPWPTVPIRCVKFVKSYVTGYRYLSDSEFVASDSLTFAKTVTINADGKDCWIFDVDDTLLSNLPYYAAHGYGSQAYNATSINAWTKKGVLPVLPASLCLYKKLQKLKFTIILITGRSESYRNVTVKNLLSAGYTKWDKLLLRGEAEQGTTAVVFKSKKRVELEEEGYRIHGSIGDQWSDLWGNATAERSFKLPNPINIQGGEADEGTTTLVFKSKKRVELEEEGYIIHGSIGDQWSDLWGNATAERSFKLPNPMEEADEGTTALVFKSKKRVELEEEGYRIHESIGDQWSDLWGNATAERSFKLPNPMYFVP